MKKQRRQFLQAFGITASMGLAGCSQQLEPTDDSSGNEQTGDPGQEPGNPNDKAEQNTSDDNQKTNYPETGTLQVNVDGEPLGPDGLFEGDVPLNIPHTEKELVEKYHFNQLQTTAERTSRLNQQQRKTLRELPHNILVHDWRMENIYFPRADMFEGVSRDEMEDQFKPEKYTGEGNFQQRYIDSNMPNFLSTAAHVTLGGPSSTNDYIKADVIAATEYHAANKETATFDSKTNDGTHGLVFGITNPSYKDLDNQETWIIETDPNEEQQTVDLDEQHSYPIKPQKIFTEIDDGTQEAPIAWEILGLDQFSSENINTEFTGGEMETLLENPEEVQGRAYLHTATVAAYINDQAHPDGQLPELQDATLTIQPDKIKYELA